MAWGKIRVNPTYKLKPRTIDVAAARTKTFELKPKRRARAKIARRCGCDPETDRWRISP